ncbi:MAG: CPBP family intramembrane glutamic endopeptidase [Candidatus Humimicrobiaceae bacterium]
MASRFKEKTVNVIKQIFTFRWRPGRDLAIVAISWILVVGSLAIATYVFTPQRGGLYFVFYGVIGAMLFGVGLPLFWMVIIRKRPISDLGITTKYWLASIILQIVFAIFQYFQTFFKSSLPDMKTFLPLLALALSIGFFEAFFWRGWVLLRLEESFGIIPAIIIGSLLYAAYHIGYGMDFAEMRFLFFIGVMFAIIFRLTKNVLILWPLFQPMGQLVTLVKDRLGLPMIAILGFVEILIFMFVMIWMAHTYYKKKVLKLNLK